MQIIRGFESYKGKSYNVLEEERPVNNANY